MSAKCPAYRVDLAIMVAVEQAIADRGGEVAHLFLPYQEALKESRALCCAAAYRRGRNENPALSAWLRKVIEPTWVYELPWWDESHLQQERIF